MFWPDTVTNVAWVFAVTSASATVSSGTFAVKSEMNVHILDKEKSLPELNDNTLTAFTWTFGIKVPF